VKRFLTAWRQAQQNYKANPKEVRQYEAKRVHMSPEQFDLLIEGQKASNPDFEEILTANYMGAPGKELDSKLMKHRESRRFSSRKSALRRRQRTGRVSSTPSRSRHCLLRNSR